MQKVETPGAIGKAQRVIRAVWTGRRLVMLALSGLFFLVAVERYVWLTVGPASWGPRFACAASSFDCGEILEGTIVKHEFTIHNTGRQTLHILQAVPDCAKCLAVSLLLRLILTDRNRRCESRFFWPPDPARSPPRPRPRA